jgi:hypothetical protein
VGSPVSDVKLAQRRLMHDDNLRGKDNFAVNREAAEKVIEKFPDARSVALANRARPA